MPISGVDRQIPFFFLSGGYAKHIQSSPVLNRLLPFAAVIVGIFAVSSARAAITKGLSVYPLPVCRSGASRPAAEESRSIFRSFTAIHPRRFNMCQGLPASLDSVPAVVPHVCGCGGHGACPCGGFHSGLCRRVTAISQQRSNCQQQQTECGCRVFH